MELQAGSQGLLITLVSQESWTGASNIQSHLWKINSGPCFNQSPENHRKEVRMKAAVLRCGEQRCQVLSKHSGGEPSRSPSWKTHTQSNNAKTLSWTNYVQDNPTRYEIIMYSYVIQHMKQILETAFLSKPLVRVTKWYLRQCPIYLLDFQLKNKVLGLGLWKK